MSEQEQILYMQARIFQMVTERCRFSRGEALSLFRQYGLAEMIEENFDLYHMEGDEYVWEDIVAFLKIKGVILND